MNELEQYKQTFDKITKLATRWVKGWGGYSHAEINKVDVEKSRIYFTAYLSSSGFNPSGSMDLKYFLDDTNLEKDSREFYDKVNKKNSDNFSKRQILENDPKVQEYLKATVPVTRSFIDGYYTFNYYIDQQF